MPLTSFEFDGANRTAADYWAFQSQANTQNTQLKAIQARIITELEQIDPIFGKRIVEGYLKLLSVSAAKLHAEDNSIEDYLKHRLADSGSM